ncbi:MAG: membrane fusion protein, multidrug efflux system [Methyloprofundus sp.]|nr:MAG: membrane fusion protein, multidrug efflux system [Methyloprofundus sp.]
MFSQIIQQSIFMLLFITLTACQEEVKVIEQVRALKTLTIAAKADGHQRQFSGIVKATNSSALSFEVGGKVQEVKVDIGDLVKKGQVLATLDKEPYRLDVQAAEADLATAHSDYKNKAQQFTRVDELEKKGWASKSEWDRALAVRDTAKNQISFTNSKLKLAKRDLRLTVLVAPFDGSIAARTIDAFVKVLPGQKLFEINAKGSMDVEFDIPETIIGKVQLGMPISIKLPTLKGEVTSTGEITFIGAEAGIANAFPAKAIMINPPEFIKPGMTADIDLKLSNENAKSGYLIPLSAILAGDDVSLGYVFIYQPATSTVIKTAIEASREMSTSNMIEVIKGISAGDIIAVAGVSYLYDGQQVKLMTP